MMLIVHMNEVTVSLYQNTRATAKLYFPPYIETHSIDITDV